MLHKTKIQLAYHKGGLISECIIIVTVCPKKYQEQIFSWRFRERAGKAIWRTISKKKPVHSEIKLPLPTLALNLWFPWNFSKIEITSDLTIYQIWNDNYPLHCEKFDTWVIIPHCVHCGLTGKGFRAFFLLSNHHHWDSKPSQATAQKPLWTHCVE